MKKIYNIYIALFALFLVSCQDVIELDVPDTAQNIAISGRVTDQGPTYVTVSTTAGFFDNGRTPQVENAAVVLYEDGDTVAILSPDSVPGLYSNPFVGTLGRTYEISVEVFPGNPAFNQGLWRSKPEQLTRVFTIDSIQVKFLDRNTTPQVFEEGFYALMYFREPPGEGDNYRVRRWKNDSLFSREIFIFEDRFFDGRYVGEPGPFGIPAFDFFGPFDDDKTDSITVEISSLSTDYYDFLSILSEQVFNVGGTFDPPPQTVIGNIFEAGKPDEFGFGYFSASSLDIGGIRFSN
jgi:hypothetical protein